MGGARVNGVVGPRGDGYVVHEVMTAEQAEEYHLPQVQALGGAGVDQVTAVTMTYAQEAVGFVRAATRTGVPAVVSHFEGSLEEGPWLGRITGIRANASTTSHAELDAAEELDAGDPEDLAVRYHRLLDRLPALELLGGCCGTDHRHVRAIDAACRRS